MKIRTRLTFLFTFLLAVLLLVLMGILYLTSSKSREVEFYGELKKEAVTKANLFLEAQVNPKTLHKIYQNNSQILNEVEVAVYDTSFHLLYHDAVEIDRVKETKEMIDKINQNGSLQFYQGNWQVIGILYNYQGDDYIVTATAYDEYGYNKQADLLKTILILCSLSILILFFVGRFFAGRALNPVKRMIDEVNNIKATSLDLRLASQKNKDELNALATTFNEMLNRLEQSFDSQKQFVSNISHELRTPLAAIITELEWAKDTERRKEEYQSSIQHALVDSKRIVKLSNSLLDFAKASYDASEIRFKTVRVDEVLLDACQQLQKSNPTYKFNINIGESLDSESLVSIEGNPYLLQVAFVNLLENACKFSKENQCHVYLNKEQSNLVLKFVDKGIGILTNDLDSIFIPFYRGKGKHFIEGNGIGLSLTKRIIELHKGTIEVQSKLEEGTTFIVKLPLVK
ncbi:sensor histidine kinase [Myroides guanonis]|uniref:histidine kinase n=1 Tax=Myroides guanonis TaxID=1150112 RepID=A0A1I3TP43_9FLAO|nr:HAMP domain-containing sensor histidine kinase [Myroides guanonis]SFJ72233.1 Signal transduction histidine kinase [Myroides guanonis]